MEIINDYTSRNQYNTDREINKKETNYSLNLKREKDFLSLINSLSTLIKDYYYNMIKTIKDLKMNILESNKYILTSKCIINEMNNKSNIQERINVFNKNIEGINLNNKYIDNNILIMQKNVNKLFEDSKIIIKKMERLTVNNNMDNFIEDNDRITSTNYNNNYNNNNNSKLTIEQNKINHYNNKRNYLKLSLDTDKLNSFTTKNKNKTSKNDNNNNNNNNKLLYLKKDKNKLNIHEKNNKHKKIDISIGNLNYIENNLGNDLNNYKTLKSDKINIYNNRKSCDSKIITDLSVSNLNKIKLLFESSPIKNRISLSNEKIPSIFTNYYTNYNNHYSSRNKNSSVGHATSRIYNNNYNDELNYNYYHYNYGTSREANNNFDDSFFDNNNNDNNLNNNNNILVFLENVIEYFYLLSQFQYYIINQTQNVQNNNFLLQFNKAINKITKSFTINKNMFAKKNDLKQKILTIIKRNDNFNRKLKLIISKTNKKINVNENNYSDYEINYRNGQINNNLISNNSLMSGYNNAIKKLKKDNINLKLMNHKVINENKLLIKRLNLLGTKDNMNNNEYNKKINLKLNQVLKENKDYIFQINNLKKDNEDLLKLIKNKNNNKNKERNASTKNSIANKNYYLDNIDYNNTIEKDNIIILSKKNNQIKQLQSLLDESKLINSNLKESEKEKDNKIKLLNEQISTLNNKSNTNFALINEKNSIIEELNTTINKLKKEMTNNKNQYNKDISFLKEQIKKNKNIKENEIFELKKEIEKNNNVINNINKYKLNIENDLNNMKDELSKKNNEIEELNKRYNEIQLIKNNKEINIDKEKSIIEQKEIENNILKEKIINYENIIENKENENKNLLIKTQELTQEISQLESIINILKEKSKHTEKNENKIEIRDIENDIINYKENDEKNENKIDINENNDKRQYSIEMMDSINENHSKGLSTPSFRSPELEGDFNFSDNLNIYNQKKDNINELKILNELLLNKIREYESTSKYNDTEENNEELNNTNSIRNENLGIKYYQNKFIHYLTLYKEYKKKYAILKTEMKKMKSDYSKAKNEIKELVQKLKDNNINISADNNNNYTGNNNDINDDYYLNTLPSLKLHNQYTSNNYIILCDKVYKEFKWFLLKKKLKEDDEEEIINTYNNLIWVPIKDIVDLDNFNDYSTEEKTNNNNEILNLLKKLEEKENMISKLSYKLEKLEKDTNILYTNSNNNNNNDQKSNSINQDYLSKDNTNIIPKRNYSAKTQKNDQFGIPLEKYNELLEKLNQTEERFLKLQKENVELRKNQKLLTNQSQNQNTSERNNELNFSSDINKMTFDNNNNYLDNINNRLGLIKKNENNNIIINNNINKNGQNEEDEEDIYYYRKKYNELEMKLKILKDACKNILIRLTIPKKDREEIKQILKIFEFSEEETSIILGDKKK